MKNQFVEFLVFMQHVLATFIFPALAAIAVAEDFPVGWPATSIGGVTLRLAIALVFVLVGSAPILIGMRRRGAPSSKN